MISWTTNIREEGLPLLDALSLRTPSAPRSFLRQLLKKQRVLLNGEHISAESPVQYGDTVTIKRSQRLLELLDASPLRPERVLYEDTQCLVINKPAGLPTHRAQGHDDNLLDRVRAFFLLRHEKFRTAPVQRLDIGTSGVVLIGKGKEAIGQLGKLIMAGGMSKRYLALVHGSVPSPGVLDAPVSAKGRIKEALTDYRPVGSSENYSLLELELQTGRQHQIRQQLAACGHPIVGDMRYGNRSTDSASRTLLHSWQLAFTNPLTGRAISINCPPPEDFRTMSAKLGFSADAIHNLQPEK